MWWWASRALYYFHVHLVPTACITVLAGLVRDLIPVRLNRKRPHHWDRISCCCRNSGETRLLVTQIWRVWSLRPILLKSKNSAFTPVNLSKGNLQLGMKTTRKLVISKFLLVNTANICLNVRFSIPSNQKILFY